MDFVWGEMEAKFIGSEWEVEDTIMRGILRWPACVVVRRMAYLLLEIGNVS